MLEKLWKTGVDVFRLNMSHGDHADKADIVTRIRAIEKKIGRPIAIMADLQGPKLRIATFANDAITLKKGQTFQLDLENTPGDDSRVYLPHSEIIEVLQPGMQVLLDDGKIRLEVTERTENGVVTRVKVGGPLSNRKGVNVPDAVLPMAALTPKDLRDLEFALDQNVDWVALSFVQRPEDVAEAKKLVAGRAGVLAKIEKPSAVERIDAIVELADAVMVARGDLGVELPVEDVPAAQRQIIRAAREMGKPVVVATQMLESMIKSPVPTRAEVSDVANAVHEGADAIMLSAESAVGDYPLEAVSVMSRVSIKEEGDRSLQRSAAQSFTPHATAEDAISAAARQVSETVGAKAIVTFTTSGATALRAARERPSVPIMVLTPNTQVARRLCIVWGLYAVKTKDVESFEEMYEKAKRMALRHKFVKGGDRIAVTAGVPFGTPGATNVLHLAWISGEELKGWD
ncbi:pyruvate kinase [Iodidimonas muriae]|uniref:Pyruvate kinase n=2 Tax=Iodidimonas muriae TaxID=261467 RepID=A0ABQ2LDS6_9PROT|nr:pyruvate kinase [Kordiimonadales bacterium JCM 17843]GGO12714.1 pyruvate kinase [Iodidimonas muriae]